MKHIGFGKIEQFRNVIRNICHDNSYVGQDENDEPVYDGTKTNPKVTFTGTVKLHGTNAGICYSPELGVYAISRNQILSEENRNAGFYDFVQANYDYLDELLEHIYEGHGEILTLHGEWCGGNVQKGVGICELPKMFVAFNLKLQQDDNTEDLTSLLRSTILKGGPLHNIYDFPTYEIEIDFENPLLSQPKLSELTIAVENECPVAKQLGTSGIGEGIVWRADVNNNIYKFKVKGEKHSVSKVKVLAAVDIEELESINEFLDYAITENRLKQGLEQFENPTIEDTGTFLRWIYNDIRTEEYDTIAENGINPKKLGAPIAKKAKKWFMGQI